MTTAFRRASSLHPCFEGVAELRLQIWACVALFVVVGGAFLRLVSVCPTSAKVTCSADDGTYDWHNVRQDLRALLSFGLGALLCGWARWKEMADRDASAQADPLERVQLFAYMM
mmetsp:Transcript_43382/g.80801  ORF Transcript_43382/g.80801 Transcript_43382/m.80801 type:complete len:114 (+) Transcript_43382:171-512(+)